MRSSPQGLPVVRFDEYLSCWNEVKSYFRMSYDLAVMMALESQKTNRNSANNYILKFNRIEANLKQLKH